MYHKIDDMQKEYEYNKMKIRKHWNDQFHIINLLIFRNHETIKCIVGLNSINPDLMSLFGNGVHTDIIIPTDTNAPEYLYTIHVFTKEVFDQMVLNLGYIFINVFHHFILLIFVSCLFIVRMGTLHSKLYITKK